MGAVALSNQCDSPRFIFSSFSNPECSYQYSCQSLLILVSASM